ncbi:hypothetical protein GUJ93_ZPchr0001g29442 [Zizania palustris]|uniref:Fumarylacetoacetase n=1 Tax=Zizania palustris TaxID=103762 RepID=A0A8J5VM61_ZIZPA|nr:hypothetical protein GUJ93_ZPchr0001g29442 [Zizania palustris]
MTEPPRQAVAIGDFAFDLAAVSNAGLFNGPLLAGSACFRQETLNMFLALGRPAWKEARAGRGRGRGANGVGADVGARWPGAEGGGGGRGGRGEEKKLGWGWKGYAHRKGKIELTTAGRSRTDGRRALALSASLSIRAPQPSSGRTGPDDAGYHVKEHPRG